MKGFFVLSGLIAIIISGCTHLSTKPPTAKTTSTVTSKNSSVSQKTPPSNNLQKKTIKRTEVKKAVAKKTPTIKKPADRKTVHTKPKSTPLPLNTKTPVSPITKAPSTKKVEPIKKAQTKNNRPISTKTTKKTNLKKTAVIAKPKPTLPLPSKNTQPPLQAPPPIKVTLESLPLYFKGWTLDYANNILDSTQQCILNSASSTLEDGAGGTPFYLQVTPQTIVAVTKSNIDLKYPDTGIQIDLNKKRVVDRLFNETSVIFEKSIYTLLTQLKQGQLATVTLGFWPTWPISQSHQALIELNEFSQAYQALLACNRISKN
ncbi:MAG: hypothetical protein KUG82_17325 [Pseudomonadales bacterium]|nr:hypothetical protein [Pseudomonadales bacterium]